MSRTSGPERPDRSPSVTDHDELAALRIKLASLEAENARLVAGRVQGEAAELTASTARRQSQRWRAPLSAFCITLAALLVPVSVIASWTGAQLVDQEAFVQTFAPLADDPDVQGMIVDKSVSAIDEAINIDGLMNDAFDGIAALGLPPRAHAAIDLLGVPASAGVRSILDNAVTTAVASSSFSSVWEQSLRTTHSALLATVSGDTSGALVISEQGEVGIRLAPIISELRDRLVEQGFGIAAVIPNISTTIVVAQSDALVTVNAVYGLAVTVSWWMPLVCVALFGLGLALARRRPIALIGSGISLALGSGAMLLGLAAGANVLALSAVELGVPRAAMVAIFAQLTDGMHATATVLFLLGVLLALFAWIAGPSRTGRRVQGVFGSVNGAARASLASHGFNSGGFGAWLSRQRVLVRVILVVLGVLWLLTLRPLSTGDVFLVLGVGLAVWWLTELAQRRPEPSPALPSPDAATAADPSALASHPLP